MLTITAERLNRRDVDPEVVEWARHQWPEGVEVTAPREFMVEIEAYNSWRLFAAFAGLLADCNIPLAYTGQHILVRGWDYRESSELPWVNFRRCHLVIEMEQSRWPGLSIVDIVGVSRLVSWVEQPAYFDNTVALYCPETKRHKNLISGSKNFEGFKLTNPDMYFECP